jgi:hypothetical protein
MQKPIFVILIVMLVGLLLWNVYLTSQVSQFKEQEKDLNLKIEMLEGTLQIMEYDLVTANDSLRIFYEMMPKNDAILNDSLVKK